MARKSNKVKAGENYQLWKSSNTAARNKWQTIAQKSFDFYLNEQLTTEETESLRDSGMPDFIINRITPIVEIMKYFVTANSPRWKAVGAEGSDTDIAQVHSDIADYCWNLSDGKSLYSQVILDSLTKGVGYFHVDVDPDSDLGQGDVIFKRVDPFDIFVDPMSRDFLFRDAGFMLIRKVFSKTQLKIKLPDYATKIENAGGDSETLSNSMTDFRDRESIVAEDVTGTFKEDGSDEELISFYECYKKIKKPYYNIAIKIPPSKEEMAEIQQTVKIEMETFEAEAMVSLEEKTIEIQNALASGEIIEQRAQLETQKAAKETQEAIEKQREALMAQLQEATENVQNKIVSEKEFRLIEKDESMSKNLLSSIKFNQTHIQVTCSVGDETFLYDYSLPFSEYPIIPVPYMYSGTPYPMSSIVPLIGKQQEINKAHQIMIHNANLASNLRWIYQEGSVPEEEWEKYSSSPGALLKYRQGFEPPTPVQPAAINNAFYTITQEGKQDIEYISGIYSSMMGNTKDQPETYRGLLANDEYGTRRIKAWMGSIVEPCLEHLGKVFKEIAQKTYTVNKVFRIVQPEAGQGNENSDERQVEINIPIYNDYGEAIGRWMDYQSAKFDVRIVAGATLPLNRWALLEEYFRWFQAGLIDDIAMLAETDIRGKKTIAKRKSLYSQLQNQVAQMEEAMKDKAGTIETLERQLVQAGIKDKIKTGEVEVRKDVLETEAQQKTLRATMKGEMDNFRKDLKREIDKARDSMKSSPDK